jgi:hypothetical protein
MCKKQTRQLSRFLRPFPAETKAIVLWLRNFIWDLQPNSNELIYDNNNALAIGWSPTDKVGHTFCFIAVSRLHNSVHFGFYCSNVTALSAKWGEGNPYRYIRVSKPDGLPKEELSILLAAAYEASLSRVRGHDQLVYGQTITKSAFMRARRASRSRSGNGGFGPRQAA